MIVFNILYSIEKMDKEEFRKNIEKLYTCNLGVKPGETVLVFTDRVRPEENLTEDQLEKRREVLELFRLIAGTAPYGIKVTEVVFDATGGHGKEPPEALWTEAFGLEAIERLKRENLWNSLLSKSPDKTEGERVKQILLDFSQIKTNAIIGMSYYSSTHTSFREFLTDLFQVRYASMPLFDHELLSVTVTADWKKIANRTKKIASLFRNAQEVLLEAPNGTNLRMGIKDIPIHEDTGLLTEPGSFGNLPAGEVFMPPEPGSTNGKLVLEFAPTWRLENSVTLIIENGQVLRVLGDDPYAEELEKFLERDQNYKNIAELGIGTNDRATRPDNILESEKILGTIHIALGDNSSFGGRVRTSFHQDFVVFHPTLTLLYPGNKRKDLLVTGKLKDVNED